MCGPCRPREGTDSMASALYPRFKQGLLSKEHDVHEGGDTVKAMISNADQNTANTAYADVSSQLIGAAVTLANRTVTNGVFDAEDISFTGLSSTDTAHGIILYNDTPTTPVAKPLMVYIDITNTDMTGVTTLTITWQNTSPYIFTL